MFIKFFLLNKLKKKFKLQRFLLYIARFIYIIGKIVLNPAFTYPAIVFIFEILLNVILIIIITFFFKLKIIIIIARFFIFAPNTYGCSVAYSLNLLFKQSFRASIFQKFCVFRNLDKTSNIHIAIRVPFKMKSKNSCIIIQFLLNLFNFLNTIIIIRYV